MSTSDGRVVGTTLIYGDAFGILNHNLVILAEGYQEAQLAQFAVDANELVQSLRRAVPFNFLLSVFNIWRVDVASTDAGADNPTAGTTARTYFDATFGDAGALSRLLTVDSATAHQVALAQVPQYDWIIVSVNSSIYGGSGGDVAVYSQHAQATEIAIHELAHMAIGLADEYDVGGPDRHPGPEPSAANVTTMLPVSATTKWGRYIQPTTAIPTMSNPNCAQSDNRPNPVAAGTVGAFEGADYSHCGAYRPQYQCRMRMLNQPFCRVCQDAIFRTLAPFSAPWVYIWKGISGDDQLYHGRGRDADSQRASFPSGAANARMTTAPAVTYHGWAYAAWKGASQSIWYSRLGARPDGQWDEPRNVSGVGTSTGPSLASFQGKLWMAWKGIVGDQGIYFNSFNGVSWTPQAGVPGVGTSTRPALAVFRGRLYMAWKGITGDPSMYFTSFDGSTWRPQAPIPNVGTSAYPSLAVLNDRLYMAWKGIDGDPSMYFTSFDGVNWQSQGPIPNVGTTSGCTLASNGRDRLFLAWSGVTPDQSLYTTTFDDTQWCAQRNYFGTGSSDVPGIVLYP